VRSTVERNLGKTSDSRYGISIGEKQKKFGNKIFFGVKIYTASLDLTLYNIAHCWFFYE
jgi:hypothetical protein